VKETGRGPIWGKEQSAVEVMNNFDGNLVNLYRHIQYDIEGFYEKLWYLLVSRDYVIKNAFGGRFGSGFAFSKTEPPRLLHS
jgi:hypothetical protein